MRLLTLLGSALLLLFLSTYTSCKNHVTPPQEDAGTSTSRKRPPPRRADKGCLPSEAQFREQMWEPLLATQCLSCHREGGAAAGTEFVLRPPSTQDYLAKNLETTARIARKKHNNGSVLLQKPLGLHAEGHTGGALVRFNTSQHEALRRFVAQAEGEPTVCQTQPKTTCQGPEPGRRRIRRLTRKQYDNTIRDLFGFNATWGQRFVADPVVHGFDNNADALVVTPLLADQFRGAAQEIAAKAIAQKQRYLPCTPSQGDARACVERFIKTFGLRVFRGPVSNAQVQRYLGLYDIGAKQSIDRGLQMVLEAMLQSPYFLYRRELGTKGNDGRYQLNSYEIASELSYFLWDTMPDQALFDDAAKDKLRDPATIAKHAKRMLASQRGLRTIEDFTIQWLGLQRLSTVPKDATRFKALTTGLRQAMGEEARRFVRHVLAKGKGTLQELLTANYSIMNAGLAAYYGLPTPKQKDAAGYGKVSFGTGPRGGILSLGAVLTTHALPNDSSPIHRGLLVRERLLCQHLPPPPPNVNAEPPGLDPKLTTRERYNQHSKDPKCAGCHQMIDPIGFGFEAFDGIGRHRDRENGQAVDTKGEIINAEKTSGTFHGLKELSQKLAGSALVHRCYTLQWMRWAYGNKKDDEVRCMLKGVAQNFTDSQTKLVDLLVALTQTPHFRFRQGSRSPATPEVPPREPPQRETNTNDAGSPDRGQPERPRPPERTSPPEPRGSSLKLKVEVKVTSQWQQGYCQKVFITNQDTKAGDWTIKLTIRGTIKQLWNAVPQKTRDPQVMTFSGVDWNRTLQPKQSAEFGFCGAI